MIFDPEKYLYSLATLLLGNRLAQDFLICQFFPELEHTVP
jgi:hypothetical protein